MKVKLMRRRLTPVTGYLGVVTAAVFALAAGCAASPNDTVGASTPPLTHTAVPSDSAEPVQPSDSLSAVSSSIEQLEAVYQARVAVSAIDTGTGLSVQHREDERFGFASTLKVFAAAQFLGRVHGDERHERMEWTQADIDAAGYSPLTGDYVNSGLTLVELAEAAVRLSDNTAMNLVLERIGGPEGMNEAFAEWGDSVTQVADIEPALNNANVDTGANTTTAAALTFSMVAVLGADHLAPADKELLVDWMSANATGDTLIRAGAPTDWVVADKSGGAGPLRNDIAVVFAPERDPIIITVLTERDDRERAYDDALVADVAAVVLEHFAASQ